MTTTTQTTAKARGSRGRGREGPHHHQQDIMIFSLRREPPLLVESKKNGNILGTLKEKKKKNFDFSPSQSKNWRDLGASLNDVPYSREYFIVYPTSHACHIIMSASVSMSASVRKSVSVHVSTIVRVSVFILACLCVSWLCASPVHKFIRSLHNSTTRCG